MKISFNPSNSNKNILDLIKNNKDIIFDLKGHSIFARGVEFKGTDTNTWRDIKINNVSIGSHTLDLRNGSNTTLTNTNGVVTINSTWRPVVDNLTSDSTTSSLSAKQGKVLKALIDGKSNSGHTHDDRYLKLTGGTMAGNALITFADSGSWGTSKKPQGARGGLYWTGQSDYTKLYAEETAVDNLDLVIQFGDDNSNGLSIRNKANTQTSYISAGGVITTGTFKGNLDWSYITNKPSSYTPSAHTHDGRYLRLSGQDTMQGNLQLHSYGSSYIGRGSGDKSGADFTEANIVIRSWWGISFKSNDDIVRTYIDTRTGNIGTKGVLNAVGAVIQGRVHNGGDDEGIIINPASNGYAGLILGTHNGERSVFYLKKGNPFWRYNNGSTNLDIYHPKKSGTIALTSDIPDKNSWNYDDRYLKLTGGWMSGDINFGGDNKIYWERNTDSASISFKNDGDGDANSYMSFVTSDNGNEYFRWSHSSNHTNTEWMALRSDGLRVRGTKVSLEGHSHNDLYYTESEVNSLLDAKLNRQNLSYGTWNPRGYHLAADYHYNGGDLSISENNSKMYVSVDGCFWQNEGQYRVLDTSDIGDIRDSVTLHQYLSATDAAWYPLVWGGASHNNTSDSTGPIYKSYDRLSWQTSSQTLYATNIQTNNIKNLSIGGGIYWNSCVESASDDTDAASITLVRQGVAGGTTLVLSQMNDANDTIQFKTNTAARLYHNSYPILTTQNTYVNNNKGYINGTEITQVNNANTVDGWHKDEINRTLYITSETSGLSSYWAKLWEINLNNQYNDVTITFLAAASYYPSYFSIFSVYLRQNGSGTSKNIFARLVELIGNIAIGDTDLRLYVNNTTGNCQLWGNVRGQQGTMNLSVLKKAWRTATDSSNIGTFFSTSFNSVQSLPGDGWYKVGVIQQGVVGAFNPAAHTHTVFKNNLMIKGTNGISDSASIHLGIGDSDTGFKWISDGVCQIYANNAAVGQWTSGGMNWFKNPTVNGNKVWNAGNDGSGSGLDADTLDGYHANGSNDRPYGHIPTIESDGVMEVGRYIDFHNDNNGKHDFSTRLQSTGNYGNEVNLPSASGTLALINDVNNYYWANVKISTSSSTTTSPTVHTLTATRVCAGHNPGIDNSISCSNWFRSSGNTGWYNTTYYGGWYMSDTSWIRAHNGVGIYTSGQIYSSSSIRMGNILLEHTDEINNSTNGGIHLNYRNSGNVSLCQGGGNVGIGTTTPSYKLDVNGQMRASGFHHSSVNSDNYILLAGGGYKSYGGDDSTPIFLGCFDLYRGDDGTISSSFYCLGYSVPFTYTRGGNYCKIVIPDTTRLSFYIIAATASVNYSGGGMDTWTGYHRGSGAWWLHCYAFGRNEVRVKGFCQANKNNDSWWGGNPLWNDEQGANKITVCIFGHVKYK